MGPSFEACTLDWVPFRHPCSCRARDNPFGPCGFDETHIAAAKVAGYSKWFNVCGLDMIKVKAEKWEIERGITIT
jgi:hypothetical protein